MRFSTIFMRLCALTILVLTTGSSFGFPLIEGGEGNSPIPDPGWPKGAAEIFNHRGRTAWWEGPPFGGGEWHSECKGDAAALNDVLKLFTRIEGQKKRLVVLDGIGYSFWLDPNGTKRGDRNTKIDWSFTVWQADRWKMQKGLPAGMSAIPNGQTEPIATITVHTAALRWSDIQVPEGIEVSVLSSRENAALRSALQPLFPKEAKGLDLGVEVPKWMKKALPASVAYLRENMY